MAFVVVGVLLVIAKLLDLGPLMDWSWAAVLAPFGLAIAWWAIADSLGITQRNVNRKDAEKKAERRRKALESLGFYDRKR